MLHIVRYLLQNGARPSINHTRNSALACVLRHVNDWEFRYDLLHMLLQEGGDPNVEGRDGSVPLMVCLVSLLHRDILHHFTHTMKVCYLNCVRILCKYGANPNCTSRSNLVTFFPQRKRVKYEVGDFETLKKTTVSRSKNALL